MSNSPCCRRRQESVRIEAILGLAAALWLRLLHSSVCTFSARTLARLMLLSPACRAPTPHMRPSRTKLRRTCSGKCPTVPKFKSLPCAGAPRSAASSTKVTSPGDWLAAVPGSTPGTNRKAVLNGIPPTPKSKVFCYSPEPGPTLSFNRKSKTKNQKLSMNPQLKLFTDVAQVRQLFRPLLTQFLENVKDSLPAPAAALLAAPMHDFEGFCAAWAAVFSSPGALPESVHRALQAIEHLALPENRALLEATVSQAPANFINRNTSPLNQALHLWILAISMPDVVHFPLPPSSPSSCPSSSSSFSSSSSSAPSLPLPAPPIQQSTNPPPRRLQKPLANLQLSTCNLQPPAPAPNPNTPPSTASPSFPSPSTTAPAVPKPIASACASPPSTAKSIAAAASNTMPRPIPSY
jgi:hypothetical protein